ncbi:hypothetical protein [Streptomyces sp. Tu 3180]|uniref:hypothetical protein n=1 Tax=Streptomyces sp. Tu 3180 TaxID=2682611 RepID=UPI001356F1E0|nr:hypothetical protein [Streptomyces sp. Tu 3180]KAF3467325.1 hypothetical protein GL259_25465 [Streptomyces sp. Tu 3180]
MNVPGPAVRPGRRLAARLPPRPRRPRRATRGDFAHGREVTLADRRIPVDGLPRYEDEGAAS